MSNWTKERHEWARGEAKMAHEHDVLDEVERLEKENTTLRAAVVKAGGCVYGGKEPGAPMNTCRSGFPGCACMDDLIAAGE